MYTGQVNNASAQAFITITVVSQDSLQRCSNLTTLNPHWLAQDPLHTNSSLLWWGAQRLNWASVCDIHRFDYFVSGKCKKMLFRSFMFNLLFNALFNCSHTPLIFLVTLFSLLQLILMLSSNCPTHHDRGSVLRANANCPRLWPAMSD